MELTKKKALWGGLGITLLLAAVVVIVWAATRPSTTQKPTEVDPTTGHVIDTTKSSSVVHPPDYVPPPSADATGSAVDPINYAPTDPTNTTSGNTTNNPNTTASTTGTTNSTPDTNTSTAAPAPPPAPVVEFYPIISDTGLVGDTRLRKFEQTDYPDQDVYKLALAYCSTDKDCAGVSSKVGSAICVADVKPYGIRAVAGWYTTLKKRGPLAMGDVYLYFNAITSASPADLRLMSATTFAEAKAACKANPACDGVSYGNGRFIMTTKCTGFKSDPNILSIVN